ncbi:MAG: MFS transporter [Lachnospiraceae bacterium]|nr:MFS transporter [Lachnospiraceae bacterium]
MQKIDSTRHLTASYSLMQSLYWILDVALLAYVTPFLEERGYSSMQIGVINACKFTAMIIFQYALGVYADRHIDRASIKKILTFLTLGALLATSTLTFAPNRFAIVIVCFMAIGMMVNSLLTMLESLSIQYLQTGEKLHYSFSRAVASFVYSLGCIVMGIFTERWNVEFAVRFAIPVLAIFLIGNVLMPGVNREKLSAINRKIGENVHSAGHLIRYYPKYRWFLIECFLMLTGFNLNIAFLIDRVRELGGGNRIFGILMAVIGFAEIPTALLFQRLLNHFSIQTMMFVMSIFNSLRAIGTSFATSSFGIVGVQLFEAGGMALYYPGAVYFIMQYVPVNDSVKGTSFLNIAGFGVSQVVSAVLSGLIMQNFGLQSLMNISNICTLLAVAAGLIMLKVPRENSLY